MKKLLVVCASAALVIAGQGVPASGAPSRETSPCPLSVTARDPGWSTIEVPPFSPQANVPTTDENEWGASAFAVWPGDPQRMIMASSNEAFRSDDGGCSWRKVFPPPDASTLSLDCQHLEPKEAAGPCLRIFELDASPDGKRIYLQGSLGGGSSAVPPESVIYVSDDAGDSWKLLGTQAAPALSVGAGSLVIAPNDPNTIYVARGANYLTNMGVAFSVSVSNDAGASWATRTLPGQAPQVFASRFTPIVINPTDPREIWTVGSTPTRGTDVKSANVLMHSQDAGASWEVIETPAGQVIQDLDLGITTNGSVRLAISNGGKVFVSYDAGRSWGDLLTSPNSVESYQHVEFGPTADSLFAFGNSNLVARFDFRRLRAFVIKSRNFVGIDASGDRLGNYPPLFTTGAGLYMLGGWAYSDGATHLLRYTGKGT